jgi:pimeloyl-ACP methyl ester carboxylesterase
MKAFITVVVLLLLAAAIASIWTPDKSREVLEAKYASPGDFLEVAGLRLHIRDSGPREAPVLILLHGFGASLHTWEPWSQMLSSAYRVVRFDLPGFGLTGPDPTGDYTDARSIHVLCALMDRLGVQRASLVGNSMGGRIVWKFAVQHPQRVQKLVLISPDGYASPGVAYGKKPVVPLLLKMMRYAFPKPMLRMNLAPAYGDPRVVTDALVSRYYDLMLAPGVRDAMIARMEQLVLEYPEPMLAQLRRPVLLVWGEKDAMIPFKNAADYVRILPNSTLVPFPELGHLPHEEAPAVSVEPVKAFFAASTFGVPGHDQ